MRVIMLTVFTRMSETDEIERGLAERAGMTQPGIARLEAGGTTPTLPLRLAAALGLALNISLAPAERESG